MGLLAFTERVAEKALRRAYPSASNRLTPASPFGAPSARPESGRSVGFSPKRAFVTLSASHGTSRHQRDPASHFEHHAFARGEGVREDRASARLDRLDGGIGALRVVVE